MRVEVIVPSKPLFHIALFERRAREQMRRQAEDTKREFEKTTATWKHDVHFTIEEFMLDAVAVGTNSELYAGVEGGTKPHIISAHQPPPTLRFLLPFTPKTRPGVIGSGSGSRGGRSGRLATPKAVMHPGTRPRHFVEVIRLQLQRTFFERMADVLKQAIG